MAFNAHRTSQLDRNGKSSIPNRLFPPPQIMDGSFLQPYISMSQRNGQLTGDQQGLAVPQTPLRRARRMPIYSEAERKERKKRQSTESARRCRARKKVEMQRLAEVFDAHERRMKDLECIVDELQDELTTLVPMGERPGRHTDWGNFRLPDNSTHEQEGGKRGMSRRRFSG